MQTGLRSIFQCMLSIKIVASIFVCDLACASTWQTNQAQPPGTNNTLAPVDQELETPKFPEIATELIARAAKDQTLRKEITALQGKDQNSPEVQEQIQTIANEVLAVDRDNQQWLKTVIEKIGWPGRSAVGVEAANCAWLLTQHADQVPRFQRQCLNMMTKLPPQEVTPSHIAYLTDRVLLAEKKPQKYGTQCQMVNGKIVPRKIEEPHLVDLHRNEMGLEPIEKYLERFSRVYQKNAQADDDQDPEPEKPLLPSIEAQNLNGSLLRQLSLTAESKAKLEQAFADAKKQAEANPTDADSLIWVGRRLGYLSRFRDSIEAFTQGVQRFPDDPRFLRHRGHRWITVREFARAIEDFEQAARMIENKPDQVEPDGQPNAAGIPTSTLHTNIWYHLGLARFLTGDFNAAEIAFRKCLAAADNNDMQVATLDWLYMTLCRLDRKPEADKLIEHITADLKILENHAYHRRLLLYRGLLTPDQLLGESGVESTASSTDRDVALATNGFGVAHWYLVQGQKQEARKLFDQVTAGKNWAAFGFIAAEVELQRSFK